MQEKKKIIREKLEKERDMLLEELGTWAKAQSESSGEWEAIPESLDFPQSTKMIWRTGLKTLKLKFNAENFGA